jgi:hypothetical protein
MFRSSHRRAAGAVLAVAALAFAGTAYAGDGHDQGHGPKTIHLTEAHAQAQPVFVDTGKPGPSVGDIVVIRDGVNDANGAPAGTFDQVCTLVELIGGPLTSGYECEGSLALEGGTITNQGPFVPTKAEQAAAITGGTGAFEKSRGELILRAEADQIDVQLAG